MARRVKGPFGPINTDLDVHDLPSGTCRDCLNTVLEGNTLEGRLGFDFYDDVALTVLNMTTCTFANGDTYIVCKTPSALWYKDIHPTAGSWLQMQNKQTKSATDRGWFFFHADRLYYFDSGGGTKWSPNTAYKAGIGMPTVKSYLYPATGGSKNGYYFSTSAARNSVTGEIGMAADLGNSESVSGAFNAFFMGSFGDSPDSPTSTPPKPSTTNYEWDELWLFSSSGRTTNFNFNWHDLALEKVEIATFPSPSTLVGADGHRQLDEPCHNAGGEPPGATIGAYNGNRAVYAGLAAADNGVIRYSLPGQPTMVPKEYRYDSINTKLMVRPRPWEGKLAFGVNGEAIAVAAAGERFAVYTTTQTYWLIPMGDGQLRAVLADPAHGAVSTGAIVQTPNGTHALGASSWTIASQRGVTNIARYRFTNLLDEIPSAYYSKVCGGYFSHRNEVWFAVPKTGSTVADRILIYDESRDSLVAIFEPTNLNSLGIVAMCEVSLPDEAPKMLVVRSDGEIFAWPNTVYTDDDSVGSNDYACDWEGFFAVESRANDLFMDRVTAHMRDNAGGLTMTLGGYRTATETDVTESTFEIPTTSANERTPLQVEFDPNLDGNMYYVKFDSTVSQDPNWGIAELIFDLERTDR